MLRENWSHRMIVANLPRSSPYQCVVLPSPISTRSCLNKLVISASTLGPPPNHLLIIWGGILELRSHFLLEADSIYCLSVDSKSRCLLSGYFSSSFYFFSLFYYTVPFFCVCSPLLEDSIVWLDVTT